MLRSFLICQLDYVLISGKYFPYKNDGTLTLLFSLKD
jgi:hypothetical protein